MPEGGVQHDPVVEGGGNPGSLSSFQACESVGAAR